MSAPFCEEKAWARYTRCFEAELICHYLNNIKRSSGSYVVYTEAVINVYILTGFWYVFVLSIVQLLWAYSIKCLINENQIAKSYC